MAFGWDDALMIGSSLLGARSASKDQKRANQLQDRAIQSAESQYNERAPLRKLGMTQLGQVEAPMNLGNLGFNGSNPFAAARGPAPSTATYGNWGQYTVDPKTIDSAITSAKPKAPTMDEMIAAIPTQLPKRARDAMANGIRKNFPKMSPLGATSAGPSGYGWEG